MDSKQNFLEAALAVGLDSDLLQPEDVLRHLSPDILASNLPSEAKTKLLAASLHAGKMDADLVFEALDVRTFAENMPRHRLWACIAEAAQKALNGDTTGRSGSKSSLFSTDLKARRRPNLSRRPARLSTRAKKSTAELDLDSEFASRRTTPSATDPTPAPLPTPAPPTARAETDANPASERNFGEWVEETATGDDPSRRGR
ncbi:MAG: hypothetical protein AAGC55_32320 [Myxococcota bacterium]